MQENLAMNCLPVTMLSGQITNYDAFLEPRRTLTVAKPMTHFKTL